MPSLNVHEEVILALYQLLYDEPYDCNPVLDAGEPNPIHVKAQKADFIFSELRIPVGDYGFSWNHHGPYSELLQNHLRELDHKPELVQSYYTDFQSNREIMLAKLFTTVQKKKIEEASSLMKEVAKTDWGGELLGSLLYISRSILPGRGFNELNMELKRRKSYFSNDDDNYRAWENLVKLNLVPART